MISRQLQKDTNYQSEVFPEMELEYLTTLNEHNRRSFIAGKANNLGRHGVLLVRDAIHIDRKTVYRGLRDLKSGCHLEKDRICQRGDGPKKILSLHPEYMDAFDAIVESNTARLPQDDTVKRLDLSVTQLRNKLKDNDIAVLICVVRQMLKTRGFKRRSCRKAKSLKDVQDRDAQFKKIESIRKECEIFNILILSLDTKKKEMVGNFKRDGQVYCKSSPKTFDHDFNTFSECMIAPLALFDVNENACFAMEVARTPVPITFSSSR